MGPAVRSKTITAAKLRSTNGGILLKPVDPSGPQQHQSHNMPANRGTCYVEHLRSPWCAPRTLDAEGVANKFGGAFHVSCASQEARKTTALSSLNLKPNVSSPTQATRRNYARSACPNSTTGSGGRPPQQPDNKHTNGALLRIVHTNSVQSHYLGIMYACTYTQENTERVILSATQCSTACVIFWR